MNDIQNSETSRSNASDRGYIVEVNNAEKKFKFEKSYVVALRKTSFSLKKGNSLALVGPSGSGKSTLLHLVGGLDKPSSGEIFLKGELISSMDDQNRGRLRKTLIGFVYQFHHLLPEFNVVENVMMPLRIKRVSKSKSYSEAVEILERIGLVDRIRNQPATLSGGERQRVAIARALVTKPSLVLADEPTGNLDRENAQKAFNLLIRLVEEFGSSLVIATHDMKLASSCNEIFSLR